MNFLRDNRNNKMLYYIEIIFIMNNRDRVGDLPIRGGHWQREKLYRMYGGPLHSKS